MACTAPAAVLLVISILGCMYLFLHLRDESALEFVTAPGRPRQDSRDQAV
jgi:hypothetical protein